MRLLFRFLSVIFVCGSICSAADQQPRRIQTSAHRGEHFSHPENSLPAIQAAIDAGMDFVELDIHTTSDGHLVLMHDDTVDRMTNGKGAVKNMTLARIRQLDLGARFPGKFPGLRVPTFDEALALAKGKIGIYIDTKDATPEALVAAVERHGMGPHVMFWSEHVSFLKHIEDLRSNWTVMPEAFNPQHVHELIEELRPRVLGFDDRDFDNPTVSAARQAGLGIFVDRQTEQEWKDAIDRGATGIQTDHPFQLMAYLRSHGYR